MRNRVTMTGNFATEKEASDAYTDLTVHQAKAKELSALLLRSKRCIGVVNEDQRLSTTNRFSDKISDTVRLQGHCVEIRKHSLCK